MLKLEEVSQELLVFLHPRVSSRVSGCPVASPCLARNAHFGAPTCLVSRVWFSRGLAVSMGEAAKLVFLSCCQL